ncbi:MAG: hotdog domain-containing protein [Candidatus Omnitrophota bacterium]
MASKNRTLCSGTETVLSHVMLPMHTNHYGSIHGAVILGFIDEVAFVAATRLTGKNVVLAAVNHASFERPVKIGSLLTLRARIGSIGRTSVKLKITIESEDLRTGKTVRIGSADLVMVAVDLNGRPAKIGL